MAAMPLHASLNDTDCVVVRRGRNEAALLGIEPRDTRTAVFKRVEIKASSSVGSRPTMTSLSTTRQWPKACNRRLD